MDNVVKGAKVSLHFSLSLADATKAVIDSSFEGEPVSFVVGDGNLPEGFESFILGMKEGEDKTFTVLPEKAFGQHNPHNIQRIEREHFKTIQLDIGLVVSFTDASKQELPGVIAAFDDKEVTVDFNHPLAGKTLSLRVHIIHIEPVK